LKKKSLIMVLNICVLNIKRMMMIAIKTALSNIKSKTITNFIFIKVFRLML